MPHHDSYYSERQEGRQIGCTEAHPPKGAKARIREKRGGTKGEYPGFIML